MNKHLRHHPNSQDDIENRKQKSAFNLTYILMALALSTFGLISILIVGPHYTLSGFKASATPTPTTTATSKMALPTFTLSNIGALRTDMAPAVDMKSIGDLIVSKIKLDDGIEINITDVTTTSLGLGDLYVRCPVETKMGNSFIVSVQISPTNVDAPKSEVKKTLKVVQSFENKNEIMPPLYFEEIEMFPVMMAELSGVGFNIIPNQGNLQVVKWPKDLSWSWSVSPKSPGNHQLGLVISIPINVQTDNEVIEAYAPLSEIIVPITVFGLDTETPTFTVSPTITPSPTLTPSPALTLTPTPSLTPTREPVIKQIFDKIPENLVLIIVAVIGLVGGTIAAILGLFGTIFTAIVSLFKNETKANGTIPPQSPKRQKKK